MFSTPVSNHSYPKPTWSTEVDGFRGRSRDAYVLTNDIELEGNILSVPHLSPPALQPCNDET